MIYPVLNNVPVRSNLIIAGHSQRHDLVFSAADFPWSHAKTRTGDTNLRVSQEINPMSSFLAHQMRMQKSMLRRLTEYPHTISCMHFVFSAFI
jgi:hypothetical protein